MMYGREMKMKMKIKMLLKGKQIMHTEPEIGLGILIENSKMFKFLVKRKIQTYEEKKNYHIT